MRVLLSVRPFHGHLHPFIPLALELVGAGHQVAVAVSDEMGPTVAGVGLEWWPAGIHPERAIDLFPDDDSDYGIEVVSLKTAELLEIMVGPFRPDIVIRDPTDLAPAVAAEALDVPCSVFGFSHFIPRWSWPILGADKTLAELRPKYGLKPDPDFDHLYDGLYLAVVPPSLETEDPLPVSLVQRMRYHVWDGGAAMTRPAWLDELPHRPTVLITLGTVYNFRSDLFDMFLEALADEDLNIICTVGGQVDPDEMLSMPDNVRVERYVPHSLILPSCDAILCHGGFNTVMGALCEGVPLVCVPVGADHEYNAQGCEANGLGIRIADSDASAEVVSAAVRTVLEVPSYAENVAALRGEIDAMPDLDAATRRLEEIAGA
jgi:UDP:flavonoid glycosyltransferase YjiC (YdhE family)